MARRPPKPLKNSGIKLAKRVAKAKTQNFGRVVGGDSDTLRASRKAAEFNEHHDIAQIKRELDDVIRVLRLVCTILAATRTLPKEIVEWAGGRIPQLVKYKNPLGPSR